MIGNPLQFLECDFLSNSRIALGQFLRGCRCRALMSR